MMTIKNPGKPVRLAVVNDLSVAMERIQEVKILPDKVIIKLTDKSEGSIWSVRMLDVILFMDNGLFMPKSWIRNLAVYDEEQGAFIIGIPHVRKISFADEHEIMEFQ